MDTEVQASSATRVAGASAVSWTAILAGTAAAVAITLLLFELAVGLDLAAASRRGVPGASLTAIAAVFVAIQWIASGAGGYLTGRLRTRWIGTHTHEVFFRDTAHGFLTWCAATIVIASGALSWSSPLLGMSHNSEAALVATPGYVNPGAPTGDDPPRYVTAPPMTTVAAGSTALRRAQLSTPDAANSPVARDAAAGSVLTALAMFIGAFIASVAAALGGRLRDLHP